MNDKKIKDIISNLAERHKLPKQVIETVVVSQFRLARRETEKGSNIRFPYIGLLYNRKNKNEDYLTHRKEYAENKKAERN